MSRKIVYFIETNEEVTGAKKIIPDILEKMPPECGAEAYYINLSGKAKPENNADNSCEDTADVGLEEKEGNNSKFVDDTHGCTENDTSEREGTGEKGVILDITPDNKENSKKQSPENNGKAAEESIEKEAEEETADKGEISSLKFVALEDCDFSQFKDATFIVPINYLFFLLSYISEFKDAKICPYVYDSQCIVYFLNQIKKANTKEITDMLNETESCLFVSKSSACGWDYGIDQYGDCIIPASADFCAASSERKRDFDPELINIGWIGAISKTAFECITRICDELYKLYGEDGEGVGRSVHLFDFHIIGVGANMGRFDFKKYCPLIRFIFPGELKDRQLDEYVCSHIDLAAGYNMNAVKGAMCGVPTVIPAIDDEPVMVKRTYVYFCDAKSYILCWKKRELRSLAHDDYTMEEVIGRLKDKDMRIYDGKRCLEYAASGFSYSENAKRILAYTDKSSLTVERLLENRSVGRVMKELEKYRSSSEENANATYYDYFNRNKKS